MIDIWHSETVTISKTSTKEQTHNRVAEGSVRGEVSMSGSKGACMNMVKEPASFIATAPTRVVGAVSVMAYYL